MRVKTEYSGCSADVLRGFAQTLDQPGMPPMHAVEIADGHSTAACA
jgi:hypothetical protein